MGGGNCINVYPRGQIALHLEIIFFFFRKNSIRYNYIAIYTKILNGEKDFNLQKNF